MLSGPSPDQTGEVAGPALTVDDKITLYNLLKDINQSRNNKITGKTLKSENILGRESPERLQDPIGEKNKHDHEENSLHDHWGEAEHRHSHQVMSSSQSRHLCSNVTMRVFRRAVQARRVTRRRTSTATLTPTITIITTSENIQKTINISRSISSLAGRDKILSL